uniref:SbsA Ig-like domain-containing protein n=1 Tax=Moorena producens (strain JHB) TaxID=1454205 RepID=A0A1D9GBW9_MOOP1
MPVVTAIFDGEVLRLDTTVNLEPGKRYAIAIETEVTTVTSQNAWDVLEGFAGTVEAPSDWAMEHDHYLYGTPCSSWLSSFDA